VNAKGADRMSDGGFGGFFAPDADVVPATIVARTTTATMMDRDRFLIVLSSPYPAERAK
jgi:hypothetical protein